MFAPPPTFSFFDISLINLYSYFSPSHSRMSPTITVIIFSTENTINLFLGNSVSSQILLGMRGKGTKMALI